jgi:hypothetical protein
LRWAIGVVALITFASDVVVQAVMTETLPLRRAAAPRSVTGHAGGSRSG